ncbi:2-amino-4-hydroxy-6-hydroxymethyldihydropteridine diphosphokinase [Hominifimenecus sp. rT4P-3]|uniref:2-amino-4-hydroxy-6- hydroxymethyldihydropteridine diphosphokinase n=1 Tax=Hominifimenecus sp. rT4P-3 TaxID=3242979 RepID=UPI003DA5F6B4
MDQIHIKNLEVYAYHGVFPEENVLGQRFVITATLFVDTWEAGQTDELSKSIHYGEVSKRMKHYMETHTHKLLERVAEGLAEDLLETYPLLEKVCLELKKPWAPVGLPLETVSVEIERGWHTAYIALGSNLGDKEGYLQLAVQELKNTKGCRVEQVSSFLRTAPYGYLEQDDFLNGCLRLRTWLPPLILLDRLHEIEQKANRVREIHWGPRTLDLDIIFYDNEIIDLPQLTVPHRDMQRRDFVLYPLEEIAPWARHPVFGKTVAELAEEYRAAQKTER